jgi:hypothetical protein
MENDEIKYYQFIGSQEDADSYLIRMPIRNQIYSENEPIGCYTVAYWADMTAPQIGLEWKLVDKPNQAI